MVHFCLEDVEGVLVLKRGVFGVLLLEGMLSSEGRCCVDNKDGA